MCDVTLQPIQLGFKWFDEGLADMEAETQSNLFNARVLKVDPAVLDTAGYQCLRRLFEVINLNEKKLKRTTMGLNSTVRREGKSVTGRGVARGCD